MDMLFSSLMEKAILTRRIVKMENTLILYIFLFVRIGTIVIILTLIESVYLFFQTYRKNRNFPCKVIQIIIGRWYLTLIYQFDCNILSWIVILEYNYFSFILRLHSPDDLLMMVLLLPKYCLTLLTPDAYTQIGILQKRNCIFYAS